MALKRHVGVVCDECDDAVGTCSLTAREARAAATEAGWFRQGERDLCPPCVVDHARDTGEPG